MNRKTFITLMGRVTVTMLLALLTNQMAWAQSEQVFSGFIATGGTQDTGNENEGYQKLVDGKYLEGNFTKWKTLTKSYPSGEGTDISFYYVDFHSDAPIPVSKYILTTGDDNSSNTGRNPKSWILKAKANENDSWTTIAVVNNDKVLEDENYKNYEYEVSVPGAYQYFRFMVNEVKGEFSQYLQLGELRFKGTLDPTNLAYTSITGVKQIYLYSGNDINVSFIVKNFYGIELTKGTDYTVAITKDSNPVTKVKDKGTYTLTLTGMGNYHGTRNVTFEVNDMIEIGVGGIVANAYLPTNAYNHYSLSQQIYTHDEIGEAGRIDRIDFYNTNLEPTRNLDIYMVNTSKSSFSSNTDWVTVTTANRVFSGNVKFSKNAWTTIELTTPFVYDGQSNLLLVVDDNTGADAEGSSSFYVYSALGQTLFIDKYYASDNPNPAAPNNIGNGQLMDLKNQIRLVITPTDEVFPPMPTGLTCTSFTSNTATLEWTETGTATAWQICIDDDEDNLISASENPFTLTGLTEDHSYTARVRAVDGAGHKSSWSDLIIFAPTNKTCIGSGTGVNERLPLSTYLKNSLSQQIYTASELGKAAAFISIDFYCSQDVDNDQDIDIYMVSTDKSSFDSKSDWIPVTDNDLVFSHQNIYLNKGWNTFVLDNRFDYDGDSNVAIMIDTHSDSTQIGTVFLTYDATAQAISYISDIYDFNPKNPLTEPSSANMILNSKNQIRILMTNPIVCPKPTALAYSNVTAHGASLSWNSEASAWQICINNDENHLIDVTATTYNLTGLNAETQYSVKVRTVCGTNDVSAWSREVSFTTPEACPAPTELSVTALTGNSATLNWPAESDQYNVRYRRVTGVNTLYSQSFGNGIFNGWTTIDNDGDGYNWQSLNGFATQYDYPWLANQAHGDNYAVCSPSSLGISTPLETDNWLISPQLTLNGTLRFYTRCMSSGNLGYSDKSDQYEVLVSTTGTATTDFVVLHELSPAPIGMWDEVSIDLSQFGGQSGYIAIRHHCSDKFLLVIDDFSISEYVFTDWTTHDGITTNSLALTNLNSLATYQWEVQKVCGGIDGSSKWAEDFFTTDHPEYKPTELSASVITPSSVTLSWRSCAHAWNVCVNNDENHLVKIGLNDVTVNNDIVAYTLTNLTHSTQYSVRVNAYGDQNSFTEWSNSISFTTLEVNPVPTGLTATPASAYATVNWTGYGDSYNVRYQYADQSQGSIRVLLSEGFENALSSWELRNTHQYSGRMDLSNWVHSGNWFFRFYGAPVQYLISPELTGVLKDMKLEFWFKREASSQKFQIGYSSTNKETDSFTWTDEISADDDSYHLFSQSIPDGTKYICWKYSSSSGEHINLMFDDILVTSSWVYLTANNPSANLVGLSPSTAYKYQVQSLKDDLISDWSELFTFATLYDVILNNSSDNSEIIAANNGQTCQVILNGRTLVKTGDWNTLCLPFSITAAQIAATTHPLYGATIKELDNTATGTSLNNNGVLTLKFKDATSIVAGKPYIVKWATTGDNISNPVFTGVTVTSTTPTVATSNDGNVKFVGQFDPFVIDNNNKDKIILLTTGNKLGYSQNARTLNCFRAHFEVPATMTARQIVVDFGEDKDGEMTGIYDARSKMEEIRADVYDLQGRKIAHPSRGLYIVNGKKVVIK